MSLQFHSYPFQAQALAVHLQSSAFHGVLADRLRLPYFPHQASVEYESRPSLPPEETQVREAASEPPRSSSVSIDPAVMERGVLLVAQFCCAVTQVAIILGINKSALEASEDLAAALIDVHKKRKITVRVLVDFKCMTKQGSRIQDLVAAGINVAYHPKRNNFMEHPKYCVVDSREELSVLIVGSFNWSQSALKNDEVLEIRRSDPACPSYMSSFEAKCKYYFKARIEDFGVQTAVCPHCECELG